MRLSARPSKLTKSKYCITSTKTANAVTKAGKSFGLQGKITRKNAQIRITTSMSPAYGRTKPSCTKSAISVSTASKSRNIIKYVILILFIFSFSKLSKKFREKRGALLLHKTRNDLRLMIIRQVEEINNRAAGARL